MAISQQQHHHGHHRLLLGADTAAPPTTPDKSALGPNLDSKVVIVLAVLLCILIVGLIVNSIIRCVQCGWFRSRPDDRGASRRGSAPAPAGLDKAELSKIPVEEYTSGEGGSVEAAECPICLAEFAEGEEVRVLPKCNHGFHMMCVDTWLASHTSCPICRQLLVEPPPNASNSRGASSSSNIEQGHGQIWNIDLDRHTLRDGF